MGGILPEFGTLIGPNKSIGAGENLFDSNRHRIAGALLGLRDNAD
jgi:hypothetical protein